MQSVFLGSELEAQYESFINGSPHFNNTEAFESPTFTKSFLQFNVSAALAKLANVIMVNISGVTHFMRLNSFLVEDVAPRIARCSVTFFASRVEGKKSDIRWRIYSQNTKNLNCQTSFSGSL